MPTPVNSVMLSGHVVNMPRRSENNTSLVTFRIASTQTWWNGTEWKDKDTVYIDVQCWRNLAENVLSSVVKGMPVVVSGELTLFEYLPEEGPVDRNNQPVKQRIYRLRANTVGTDLNWATVVHWVKRTGDKGALKNPAAHEELAGGDETAAASTNGFDRALSSSTAVVADEVPSVDSLVAATGTAPPF